LLFINIFAALFTLYPELVGKHLDFSAAARAFVQGCPQVFNVLAGAFAVHGCHLPSAILRLNLY
jgi:hypothetical protein